MSSASRLIAVAVAVLAGAAFVVGGSAAWATDARNDPGDCPTATLDPGPITFVEVEEEFLPPELRGLDYDCSFDHDGVSDEEARAGAGIQRLLLVDNATYAEFQDVVRGFAALPDWAVTSVFTPTDPSEIEEVLDSTNLDYAAVSFQRTFPEGEYFVNLSYVAPASQTGSFTSYYTTDDVNEADPDYMLTVDNALGSYFLVSLVEFGEVDFAGPASDFGFETPSVLSGLDTIGETVTPPQVAFASGGAVVLGLLMVFPSRLLSDVRGRLLPRIVARLKTWWAKRRGTEVAPPKPKGEPRPYEGWALALGGLFVASILTVFIDPRAGFDLGTLRLFGSVFAAFVLDVAIGWLTLTLLVSRLVPAAVPRLQFKPWTLALVVGAVLFTRVLHLEPGLTVGLVAGVVFGGVLAAQQRVRLTLAVLGHGFVLSILAWIAYSILSPAISADAGGWAVFVLETLAAITIAGIVALPLALLPVRGLTGYDVFAQSRVIWAIAYGLGLAAFLLILVPFPTSWKEVPYSFIAWLGLFVGYLVAAVVAWLVVVKPWRPESAEEAARRATDDVESVHR